VNEKFEFGRSDFRFEFVLDLNLGVCSPWRALVGVATMSRMLKNISLCCKRALQKRPIFCKETYIFKHPINRGRPIADASDVFVVMVQF